MTLFRESADIKVADQLDLPVPDYEMHTVVAEASERQKELIYSLSERAEKVRDKQVAPEVDNLLKITSDGRKIGLDQRMIDDSFPFEPEGKVALCINNIKRIYDETRGSKSAQIVFCDLSTPKGGKEKFSVYDDMKMRLIRRHRKTSPFMSGI